MNKKTKWSIVVIMVCVVVYLAVRKYIPQENSDIKDPQKSEKQKGGNDRKPLNVKSVILRKTGMSDGIFVNGNILPDEEVNLSFETSGKITEIYFKEGTRVKKGELLAKINDAPLQAQLKELEAKLKLTNDKVYRQNELLKKEAVSKEALQEAEANLAQLNAEIEQKHALIAQTELRAPFNGIIGLRKVSKGAYVSPTTEVATLTCMQPLKIEFSVPERYASELKTGSKIKFTIEGRLDTLSATIYAYNSRVDTETHTYTLRAHYPNEKGDILPGRYASISIQTATRNDALAVPSEAIIAEMGIDKVFIYQNGKSISKSVKKGIRNSSHVQIVEGLSEGDTVITTGIMQLREGLDVTLDAVN